MKYSSNIKKKTAELEKRFKALDNFFANEAKFLLSDNIKRIHQQGKAVNGSFIGSYSTNPIYVNPNRSPRKFSTIGKTNRKKFFNGKPHKTRYFGQGYRGYKQLTKGKTLVTLINTGALSKSLIVVKKSNYNYSIRFMNDSNQKKALALEAHFKKQIYGATQANVRLVQLNFYKQFLSNAKS